MTGGAPLVLLPPFYFRLSSNRRPLRKTERRIQFFGYNAARSGGPPSEKTEKVARGARAGGGTAVAEPHFSSAALTRRRVRADSDISSSLYFKSGQRAGSFFIRVGFFIQVNGTTTLSFRAARSAPRLRRRDPFNQA
jgi:hypothetical protein